MKISSIEVIKKWKYKKTKSNEISTNKENKIILKFLRCWKFTALK